MERQISRTLVY